MKLDLSKFDIYDKWQWLCDFAGDYDAVDSLLRLMPEGGIKLEKVCLEESTFNESAIEGDMIAWWLDGGFSDELMYALLLEDSKVSGYVDQLLEKYGLNDSESDFEESYNAFCAERNK